MPGEEEALAEACRLEDAATVRALVGRVDVNHGSSNPPLTWAVIKGNWEIFELLVTAGADVRVRNKNGWTALHYAAFITNRVRMAEVLLDAGADVDGCTPNNFPTPLHKAVALRPTFRAPRA